MKHELKSWPEYFQPVWVGTKTFEIRKNDRQFKVHDEIVIKEWEPSKDDSKEDPDYDGYSGREIDAVIEYITSFCQKPGYIVMQIRITMFRE